MCDALTEFSRACSACVGRLVPWCGECEAEDEAGDFRWEEVAYDRSQKVLLPCEGGVEKTAERMPRPHPPCAPLPPPLQDRAAEKGALVPCPHLASASFWPGSGPPQHERREEQEGRGKTPERARGAAEKGEEPARPPPAEPESRPRPRSKSRPKSRSASKAKSKRKSKSESESESGSGSGKGREARSSPRSPSCSAHSSPSSSRACSSSSSASSSCSSRPRRSRGRSPDGGSDRRLHAQLAATVNLNNSTINICGFHEAHNLRVEARVLFKDQTEACTAETILVSSPHSCTGFFSLEPSHICNSKVCSEIQSISVTTWRDCSPRHSKTTSTLTKIWCFNPSDCALDLSLARLPVPINLKLKQAHLSLQKPLPPNTLLTLSTEAFTFQARTSDDGHLPPLSLVRGHLPRSLPKGSTAFLVCSRQVEGRDCTTNPLQVSLRG